MYEEWLVDLPDEGRGQLDNALRKVMRRMLVVNPDPIEW